MVAAKSGFLQYHDSVARQPISQGSTADVLPDEQAQRKLKLTNDGIEQNLWHQKILFYFIIGIVVISVVSIIGVNAGAAIGGTHLEASVLVSFNAAIAVQSFLLLGVLARSLFPTAPKGKQDPQDSNEA